MLNMLSKRAFWSVFASGLLTGGAITGYLRPGHVIAANPSTANKGNIADLYAAIKSLDEKIATVKRQQVLFDKVVQKLAPAENESGEILAFGTQNWYGPQGFHSDAAAVQEGRAPNATINGQSSDGTRGIIAILSCPSDPLARSLSVDGGVVFRNPENGAYAQFNNCQDPTAPTLEIGSRDIGAALPIEHAYLKVTGPAGSIPLVELKALEPIGPRESYAAVATFRPYDIPDVPMPGNPVAIHINGGRLSLTDQEDEAEAAISSQGVEFNNPMTGWKSSLNAIELLVRKVGHGFFPAGIKGNPQTGDIEFLGDLADFGSFSADEAYIDDLTTRNLTEINPTDGGPF